MTTATRLLTITAATVAMVAFGCQKNSSERNEIGDKGSEAHAHHDEHAGHNHGDHAGHDHGELAVQTTCPVMGGEVNKELYVEKDGKRIYVCCEPCKEKVAADFAKYEEKLKEMGQKPEQL
ncbi:MAG: hypothetical protein GF344_15925 [Chitinivibrionales bacterium]|nr:hypothetical protein [Chitinivibrionales bacterium]MBD3358186.1 hypothetical protein [Chitinivibrionales bacterium]